MWICAVALSGGRCSDHHWFCSRAQEEQMCTCEHRGGHSHIWAAFTAQPGSVEGLLCTSLQIHTSQDFQEWSSMKVCLKEWSGLTGRRKLILILFATDHPSWEVHVKIDVIRLPHIHTRKFQNWLNWYKSGKLFWILHQYFFVCLYFNVLNRYFSFHSESRFLKCHDRMVQ